MAQTFTSTDVVSTTNVFADNQSQRTNENTLRSTFSGTTQPSDPVVGQQWYDTANSKTMQYNGTTWVPIDTNGTTQVDVSNAKGSLTSLTSYLRIAHNDDGTLKSSPATAIDEFKDNALPITYLSPTSFTVPSDLTSIFTANRKVKVYLSASTAISYVASSTFSTVTTVTLGAPVLDATVTAVKYSIIQDGMPQDYSLALAESTGYGIVSGCTPSINGLTVTVVSGVVHLADGTRKEVSASTVVLNSADSTNPRIDLVYVDTTGAVSKVTGTAAASPSAPALPSGGISVAHVSMAPNATTGTITDTRGMLPRWYNAGIVNVKDFGAVGDGVHDDTTAIQAAIDYAVENNSKVIINSGTYLTSTLHIRRNIDIIGNGTLKQLPLLYAITTSATTIGGHTVTVDDGTKFHVGQYVAITGDGSQPMYITAINGNTISLRQERIRQDGGTVYDGFIKSFPAGSVIHIYNLIMVINYVDYPSTTEPDANNNLITDITISGVSFAGNRSGFNQNDFSVFDLVYTGAIYAYRADNVAISDGKFVNFYSSAIVNYGRNNNFNVDNCVFDGINTPLNTTFSPIYKDNGFAVTSHWDQRFQEASQIPSNVIIKDCEFKNSWGGIFSSAVKNAVYKNNIIHGCYSGGIIVYGGDNGYGTANVIVDGNSIYDIITDGSLNNSTYGVRASVTLTGAVILTNNIITIGGVDSSCILLELVENATISNNKLSNFDKGKVLNARDRLMNTLISKNTFSMSDTTGTVTPIELNNTSVGVSRNIILQGNYYAPTVNMGAYFVLAENIESIMFIDEIYVAKENTSLINNDIANKPNKIVVKDCYFKNGRVSGSVGERNASNITIINCNVEDYYVENSSRILAKSTDELTNGVYQIAPSGTMFFRYTDNKLVMKKDGGWLSTTMTAE